MCTLRLTTPDSVMAIEIAVTVANFNFRGNWQMKLPHIAAAIIGVYIRHYSHYIAHTEPIFKKIHMVKIIDMFSIAVWNFYYKLMNDLLPPYFNYIKPNLPVICNHYNVRNPKFHLPAIKHDFAKQLIQHCLVKLLNKDENISEIANKVFDQTFCMFKSTLKNKVITSYNDKFIDPNNCVSCKRMALDVHGLVGVDVVDGVDGVDGVDAIDGV